MKYLILPLFLLLSTIASAQLVQRLSVMPEPVSNNAVVEGSVNGVDHVYSFSGIDSTKTWSGIHKKAFRYNVATDVWDTIAPLPSGTGRIAAGASNVKNKIYIIGGYEVFSNGTERTLNEVHIYDPETNTYLPDGQPVPVPTDDHVQAVWKDSLIFVVTGWSQNTNIPNVQIYNPTEDEWLVGTPVPNTGVYKAFGASGTILGDTLYYLGGARIGNNFPASTFLRKGYINPSDPTDISWSAVQLPNSKIYRAACAVVSPSKPTWFGGSNTTYNYDGVAYNGSGGVEPTGYALSYSDQRGILIDTYFPDNVFPNIMDFRGVGDFQSHFILAGGMGKNQEVSDSVFQINLVFSSTNDQLETPVEIFPNPTTEAITIKFPNKFTVTVFNLLGHKLKRSSFVNRGQVSLRSFPKGTYFLKIENEEGFEKIEKIIKTDSF